MAHMTLQAELPQSGLYVEFTGSQCEAWPIVGGDVVFQGFIDDMPKEALEEAIALGYVKPV